MSNSEDTPQDPNFSSLLANLKAVPNLEVKANLLTQHMNMFHLEWKGEDLEELIELLLVPGPDLWQADMENEYPGTARGYAQWPMLLAITNVLETSSKAAAVSHIVNFKGHFVDFLNYSLLLLHLDRICDHENKFRLRLCRALDSFLSAIKDTLSARERHVLLLLLDDETLLDFMYSLVFDMPAGFDTQRHPFFQFINRIIAALAARSCTYVPPANQAAYRAVRKYGSTQIAKCLFQLVEERVHNVPILIFLLFRVDELQEELVQAGIVTALLRLCWENLAHSTNRWTWILIQLHFIDVLVGGLRVSKPAVGRRVLLMILSKHDYLSMVGVSLQVYSPQACEKSAVLTGILREILVMVAELCTSKYAPRNFVEHEWRHVHRSIKGRARHPNFGTLGNAAGQPLKLWEEFGRMLDIELHPHMESIVGDSLFGCSWVKCPLYYDDRSHDMLACQCRRAQYCGISCQRRDWREGTHRPICTMKEV